MYCDRHSISSTMGHDCPKCSDEALAGFQVWLRGYAAPRLKDSYLVTKII